MALKNEVQKHGFLWERSLLKNVYSVTDAELAAIKYTNKMDLPANLNKLGQQSLSIKTTGSPNAVCMADALRIFDAVSSNEPFHLVVVTYKQDGVEKNLKSIIEVDLTDSAALLFGTIKREQIEELVQVVKKVPQKRSPTADEYKAIYELRDRIQTGSLAIHLDPKCNSQQSRLQCSFNRFGQFLAMNPGRIIARSMNGQFRGGSIIETLKSARRIL
jgi:hypothetical protein